MTSRLSGTFAAFIWGLPCLALAAEILPADSAPGLTMRVAAKDDDLPLSKDDLFGTLPEKDALPASKDVLFGADPVVEKAGNDREKDLLPASKESLFDAEAVPPISKKAAAADASPVRGYFQTELARTIANPDHWSKVLGRLEIGTQGRLGQGVQWKVSGRFDYNAVYDLTDFYQPQVRNDQQAEFQLRETYLDFSAGDWDWRLGRQHIVWGEMVGLFFADVVSAKDLREFVLPDFQVLRIPQWAARTEFFDGDFHAELVWIPFPSYDNIGKPTDFSRPGSGANFYPYPPSSAPMTILAEDKPGVSLSHTNFGARVTQLTRGWDLSGFYYTSMNSYPTWYRDPVVKTTFTPKHDRIWQMGATVGKDLGNFVLKAEAVYTNGRRLNLVSNLADSDGVVKQNTLDWAVGLDFNPGHDTRVNTQLYQSYTFDHDADTIPDKAETGVSLLVNHKLPGNWQAEILLVHSLNRSDWMARPKAIWGFQPNWKLSFGLDVLGGPPDGLFGQHDSQDRAYLEVRYDY
ncbi:MAG: hypothetical protein Q8O79_03735 [Pseudomonadota bacterium]|nr:hypothetical protein [Pseudomonadota bacterium]